MPAQLRVLIIEDDENDCFLFLRELARIGRPLDHERVADARGVETALDRQDWDLVLSDFSMPGFSGRAALDIVRERGLDTPFIFVSGTIGENAAVAAMRAGASDYVMKSDLGRLVPAVERELREAEKRRASRVAQEELRRSEDRFLKSFSASPIGIAISSLDGGRYLDVNPALLELLGYTRDEIIGRTAVELGIWGDPSDRKVIIEELRHQGAVRNRDVGLRTRSGEVRSVLASFEQIELGGEACLLSFILDLTDRRRLEEQLRHSQRLEAIGRLAGGVAHDFNNLLAVILGFCELLLESTESGVEPKPELTQIQRAAEAAAALTRQLLAFGGKQVLRPVALDLSESMARAAALLERLLGAQVEIVLHCTRPAAASVRADSGQIDQVIVNLAVNARDAMPAGGRLELGTSVVDLDAEEAEWIVGGRPGRFAVLSVADSGIGMSAEVKTHLFEPFFTTKEPGKGTGLGLATVWGIVAQSGGFLAVDSELGRGTTFRVFLPWSELAVEPVSSEPVHVAPAGGAETVLLVEDAPGVRKLTRKLLEGRGYRVFEAANGDEALRIAAERSGELDLVLTDLVMPGMSGKELADRLVEIHPRLKFLFTSGYTSDSALHQGLVQGSVAFLEKPFTAATLAAKVRAAIDSD